MRYAVLIVLVQTRCSRTIYQQLAHFLLEEHRPAKFQRPPLAALPARADLQWFINGTPASEWVPTVGEHTIKVARGARTDEITIYYE